MTFRPLFAYLVIALGSRHIVHVGATRHPTDAWAARQLREATPFECGPQFEQVAAASGIRVLRMHVRAPRANATCERFLGGVRRE